MIGMMVAKHVATPQNSGLGAPKSQQRDADGVRAHDQVDFAHDLAAGRSVERQHLADISLHASAADKHKIKYEEQDDHAERKIENAFDDPLSDLRQIGQERPQVVLLPQIVARPLADQIGEMFQRSKNRLRIYRDVLHPYHQHPDNQADRNQEQHDAFSQQHRSRQTAPPVPPLGQIPHLPPQQHIDRGRAKQSAQERHQLDEDGHAQPHDQHEQRIMPIFFTKRHRGRRRKECAANPSSAQAPPCPCAHPDAPALKSASVNSETISLRPGARTAKKNRQ